jgi:hemoglobin
MKASHTGLGSTEANWRAATAHLVASLDYYKVPPKEKEELLAIVATLKPDIVER